MMARFEIGLTYEVSAPLGSYLIATGCAEAIVLEREQQQRDEEREFQVNVRRWRHVAAEVTRSRRRNRE